MTNHARQIMLMVAALHRMGYEGLRLLPGLSPSGMHWRCTVLPVTRVRRDNGTVAGAAPPYPIPRYSSGGQGAYFGWTDAHDDPPELLAEKFVARFSKLAAEGKRPDLEYAEWYRKMLAATQPEGVIYAYADFDLPPNGIGVAQVQGEVVVPWPPGGLA